MYAIKSENEDVLCRGCLSTNRKLSPLTNYELYGSLLGIKQSQEEYKYVSVLLCWECLALLRRTQAFQRRLQRAQMALSLAYTEVSIKSLSLLECNFKQDYDYIIEETIQSEPPSFPYNIDVTDIKEEQEDSFETDNLNDNDYGITEEKEEENEENSKKHGEIKKKGKYKRQDRKEIKRAQKLDNVIDINDPDKYFSKTSLTEKDIEELLEKGRDGYSDFRLHECEECGYRFTTHCDLHTHKKIHTRRRQGKCKYCTFAFSTQWDLQLHWWRCHPVNRCSLCGQVVLRDSERKQHLEKHRYKYRCRKCDAEFINYQLYQYHFKQLHSKFICDHCGRNNASKTSLLKHILRQHLPNRCPECPLVFATYQRLSRHRAATHVLEHAYCVECDRTFPNSAKYKKHLNQSRNHRVPAKVSVPCPECGKTFSRTNFMNNHMKLIHLNASRHHCQLCDKYFVTGFSLRCHNKYVHEKLPKPKNKICKVCGRGFVTNRVLENHMRTHTGERPFSCVRCSAAFAQRVALKAHLAAIHKEKLTTGGAVPVAS